LSRLSKEWSKVWPQLTQLILNGRRNSEIRLEKITIEWKESKGSN
jgi:hypothetical protein